MDITIRYTQPLLFEGQVVKTADHVIECHASDTFANGQPVPVGDSAKWAPVLENLESLTQYEIVTP